MKSGKEVKAYLQQVMADLDAGRAPRRWQAPWWVRASAGPAALGIALGLGGCTVSVRVSDHEADRAMVREAKMDGFEADLCAEAGEEAGCDLCAAYDLYGDDTCDVFCDRTDQDCLGEVTPLYAAPIGCASDDDCDEGEECVMPESSSCPEGAFCIMPPPERGTCEVVSPPCSPGDDGCDVGPVPLYAAPIGCALDDDCAEGEECVIPESAGCPEGAFCIMPPPERGTCVEPTSCFTDDDCLEEQRCVMPHECPEGALCIMPPSPMEGHCEDEA